MSEELDKLSRREVRYWCFRFQTEIENGTPADDAPKGLKQKLEKQEHFRGWEEFAKSWDISSDQEVIEKEGRRQKIYSKPLETEVRSSSVWEEWDREAEKSSRIFDLLKGKDKKKKK
jgi:hypothetical protein